MKFLKLIFCFIFLVFLSLGIVLAANQDAKDITSTIKISVCGDGIIEGSEDCEGEDLNSQTCEGLRYGPGILTCDIACEFDTSGCSPAPTPTPTPTSTPTLTPTPTNTPTQTPTLTPTPTSLAVSTNTPSPEPTSTSVMATSFPTLTLTPTPTIPSAVEVFDLDGNGKIELTEVFGAVKTWVEEWKAAILEEIKASYEGGAKAASASKIQKCDLNRDRECNLLDFSILLYYIER